MKNYKLLANDLDSRFTNNDIYAFLINLNNIDKDRIISLSSGNLNDSINLELLFKKKIISITLLSFYFFKLLLPLDLVFIYIRTILRKICSPKPSLNKIKNVYFLVGNHSNFRINNLPNFDPKNSIIFKFIPGINFSNSNSFPIESFISFFDSLLVLFILPFFRIIYLIYFLSNIYKVSSKTVYINLIFSALSKSNTFTSFIYKKLLIKVCSSFNKKSCLYFPFEGRNWEKAICASHSNTIGISHTYITPKNTWIFNDFHNKNEVPQKIIVFNYVNKILLENLFSQNKINIELIKNNFPSKKSSSYKFIKKKSILFALTGDIDISKKIILKIKSLNLTSKYNIFFRPNRNSSSLNKITNFIHKNYFKISYNLNHDLCFSRSSSLLIYFLSNNIKSIYLDFDDLYSNNIFDFFKNPNIPCVSINDISNNVISSFLEDNYNFKMYDLDIFKKL